jgi:gamma-glutamyltranspeptidase/glutathione hydrolase
VLGGCSSIGALPGKVTKTILGGPDPTGHLTGFIGGVAGDEPRAVLAAREVLATGGNAADAAVTLGFMLAVTLPSRASLGGGGACIAYQPAESSPNGGVPEAILFPPRAPAASSGDRPAAVPMLARGLYLLSARYGTRPFESLIAPAQQVAQDGFPISRALARDLSQVARPLIGDPAAAAVFAPAGTPSAEGDRLVETDLAATLTQLRAVGVGDMYQGLLAHKLAEASAQAGGGFSVTDLRQAVPVLARAAVVAAGGDQAAFLPPLAEGQEGAAAVFAASRSGVGAAAAPDVPPLPASTSFVVLDRKGGAVACALGMDNLFGTGRVAPGTGIVLAASPAAKPMAILTAAIAWSPGRRAFRAAVGASGQAGAALAGASAMSQALAGDLPQPLEVPDPGRANAIGCSRYVPGGEATCRWAADPRLAGLAAGGN